MPASLFWSPAAPMMPMRISEDALPPSMGRSCTSTTFTPWRAAESAAQMPERPPPHTTNCVLRRTSFTTGAFASVRITLGSTGEIGALLTAISALAAIAAAPARTINALRFIVCSFQENRG